MAITNFTPGPWRWQRNPEVGFQRLRRDNEFSLEASTILVAADEVDKADSHLLRSAPDLYAALDAFLDAYEETGEVDFAIRQKARAALNRAEGRTP